ncbi:CBS domain-containing protein [Marininema mesophilum]|uniref:CBS domain-containing protein n=1 Tax=Marininema mesophilum TaxID=1048340 RepID=A0A1H2ZG99_9BACL|nr:DUF294 nucleotidyltransferase-like domain-containing protein [Marininema mesophilum]SDX16337.1 CBS domain-containing protein [Marininema mesophilum]
MTYSWETESKRLLAEIENAMDTDELRGIHRRLPGLADQLEQTGYFPVEITTRMAIWHDSIFRRVLELVKQKLEAERITPLPQYCWLVLGSNGRGEATFWTDQDNALIYEKGEMSSADAKEVVSRLTKGTVEGLAEAGYPLCQGNVMATNPRWQGSLDDWSKRLKEWVEDPQLDHARYTMIASDARAVAGDESLYRQWRDHFQSLLAKNPSVLVKESQRSSYRRIPLGPFSRLYTEVHGPYAGKVDIKEGGYLQLVESIRLWSLRLNIKESSTKERLKGVSACLNWPIEKKEQVWGALDTFLWWRLSIHAGWEDGLVKEADNHLDPDKLTKKELSRLKGAMRIATALGKEVQKYGDDWDDPVA